MNGPSAKVLKRGRRKPAPRGEALIRIVLIRHGKPDVGQGRWITHRKFQDYIEEYEQAGLHPDSPPPPEWLVDLTREARRVYASDRPRAGESAKALAPHAALSQSSLFMEAQLKSPKLPLVRLKPPAWAVLARLAWHAGHHGGIEDYRDARDRALKAVEMLGDVAREDGIAVLVAHGYFNAIVGRTLRKQGWERCGGRHRAKFWNAVVYERAATLP
ncbi:MAG: histidine phosphatase family protein [Alphaproteobacteria bacterium]|nr:histidine phosphatase family protein [Alphaproteobacteria bacterium]